VTGLRLRTVGVMVGVMSSAPRPFRDCREPLFVAAALLYAVNRLVLRPLVLDPQSFVHCHLADVCCVPVCLPLALVLQQRLGLRRVGEAPRLHEVIVHWLWWSFCFEWAGPRLPWLAPGCVADPLDVLAYGAGALVAALWWCRPASRGPEAVAASVHWGPGLVATAVAACVLGAYRVAALLPSSGMLRAWTLGAWMPGA
jgi:hypothetical protein